MVRIESGMAVARAWPDARFHATAKLGHQQILRNREVVQHAIDFYPIKWRFKSRPPLVSIRAMRCLLRFIDFKYFWIICESFA